MDASSLQTRVVVEQQKQGNIREMVGSCDYLRKQIVKGNNDNEQRSEWVKDMRSQPRTLGCVWKASFS
jgi:hypothetical protein